MPRNFSKYQYETSPRKLEPEYTPVKNPYKKKKTTARKVQTTNKNKVNEIKKRKMKVIKYIAIGFLIIFGISLRNSQIDENFAKIQDLKSELAEVEKQNAQLEVAIENGMNLNNLEQEAKTQLGMQKLSSKQTVYITLPKKDYVETAAEKVVINEPQTWWQKITTKINDLIRIK